MSNLLKIEMFPVELAGRLKAVTYELNGETFTVDWSSIKKVQAGEQFCLVAPEHLGGGFMSICRVKEIPEVKKLKLTSP